ncbi:MAG: AcrR family transcriptional regulator [Myxococcota bacterium]|jgi:AcrR family transcriptional regulator
MPYLVGMDLRTRHRRTTRTLIAEAAAEAFARDGFDAVTIDAVAVDAGVSRRTVFRYFATKEDLFFAGRAERLAAFEASLAGDGPPWPRVRDALLGMAAAYLADRDAVLAEHLAVAATRSLSAADLAMDQRWEAAIAKALEPRGLEVADQLAGALMGIIRAVLTQWYATGASTDLVAGGRRALSRLEAGFGLSEAP